MKGTVYIKNFTIQQEDKQRNFKIFKKDRHGGSHLQSQCFGKWRWAAHLRPEVQDQPDRLGETTSLLKYKN